MSNRRKVKPGPQRVPMSQRLVQMSRDDPNLDMAPSKGSQWLRRHLSDIPMNRVFGITPTFEHLDRLRGDGFFCLWAPEGILCVDCVDAQTKALTREQNFTCDLCAEVFDEIVPMIIPPDPPYGIVRWRRTANASPAWPLPCLPRARRQRHD